MTYYEEIEDTYKALVETLRSKISALQYELEDQRRLKEELKLLTLKNAKLVTELQDTRTDLDIAKAVIKRND